ncbi:MAG: polysaccharide deacetylase family protein [Gemmatimonadetes bacterium]|nr:polysaccharide deacetylase family protein [Gemmatimonadota bacterium]
MRGVRTALAHGACALGVDALARRARTPFLLIVCYHGVREDASPTRHWLLLARSVLERQLQWLGRHYDVLLIDEALVRASHGGRRPMAAITFDDGYRSNSTLALPLLQSLGLPATVYLTTGSIDSGAMLWTTWLDLVLDALPAPPAWLPSRGGRGAGQVKEALKRAPSAEREALLARLREDVAADERVQATLARHADDFAMLTWEEVRASARTGVLSFGAHTVSHPIVSRLPDADVAREIGESMRRVGEQAGAVSRTFAYPNGRAIDFDARAVAAVRANGGIAAVTTMGGVNRPGSEPFALRRLVVGDGDVDEAMFRLRAAGLGTTAA